jgi:hypothetical protein
MQARILRLHELTVGGAVPPTAPVDRGTGRRGINRLALSKLRKEPLHTRREPVAGYGASEVSLAVPSHPLGALGAEDLRHERRVWPQRGVDRTDEREELIGLAAAALSEHTGAGALAAGPEIA